MCHSFLIRAHGTIKYIVNMWEMFAFAIISCYRFQNLVFVYHNIPFVYITIIMRFYITIYHLSQLHLCMDACMHVCMHHFILYVLCLCNKFMYALTCMQYVLCVHVFVTCIICGSLPLVTTDLSA